MKKKNQIIWSGMEQFQSQLHQLPGCICTVWIHSVTE